MTEPVQFESFMRNYQNMVFTTAFRLLNNESEAEDISQEAFLRAFEHFDELSTSPTAGGWLKTVTRNLCLNHLTRYRARWRFFSEFGTGDESDDFEADLPAPDLHGQVIETGDQRELLAAVLQKLPDAQRVPLVLFHFDDLSYEEIAEKLKISLGKVKTDIHRGRENLRRKLRSSLEIATC